MMADAFKSKRAWDTYRMRARDAMLGLADDTNNPEQVAINMIAPD